MCLEKAAGELAEVVRSEKAYSEVKNQHEMISKYAVHERRRKRAQGE